MIFLGGNQTVTRTSRVIGKDMTMNASATGPAVVPDVAPSVEKKPKSKLKTKPTPPQRDTKPTRTLPTDRIGFDKQLDILRAYAAASSQGSKSVTLEDLAQIMKMSPTTVTMANPFLSSVGFISRTDTGYMPAQEVLSFLRAYEWNRDTAAHKMGPIVENSWFFTTVKSRLEFGPQEEEEVIQMLGETASASQEYRKGLRTLVEYMIAVGLVQRDGSQLRLSRTTSAVPASGDASPPKTETAKSINDSETKNRIVSTAFSKTAEGAVHFNVSVRVDMEQFAGWQPERIAAFFAGIAEVLKAKAGVETEN
jgi:hypothetical protein